LSAQSNLYRRLSANLYETKNPGEYFHLHGSLEATTALNMIGLPGHNENLADYHDCIDLIEGHVKRFTTQELESMNAKNKQAGVTCLKPDEFKETEHVRFSNHRLSWSTDQVFRAACCRNNLRGA
jgi:hypothetical protein